MIDLKASLQEYLLVAGRGPALSRKLFGDYIVELAPESGRWNASTSEIYIYVKSARFALVMKRLFGECKFPVAEYENRKLRKDETGTLAMVLTFVESQDTSVSLLSAGKYITLQRMGGLLRQMDSPENLFRILYGELTPFLALIEGMWVYLYLAAERGLGPHEILDELSSPILQPDKRRWHSKRAIDLDVIQAFLQEYRALFPGDVQSRG